MEFDYQLKGQTGSLRMLQTQEFDQAPTIIFLHDSLGCIKLWRDFPQFLGVHTRCNILVYDRLGYGKSSPFPENYQRDNDYLELEADLLIDIINDLNIKKPILFGHSDGGFYCFDCRW